MALEMPAVATVAVEVTMAAAVVVAVKVAMKVAVTAATAAVATARILVRPGVIGVGRWGWNVL